MALIPPLRELRFGRLDAQDEATSDDADLLQQGFFDHNSVVAGIEEGKTFLILGLKGTGKSAILEHLRLSWAGRFDRFFDLWDLRGFPLGDVRGVKTGQQPSVGRTQSAWEFLLLMRAVDSLSLDNKIKTEPRFEKIRSALIEQGLLTNQWKTKVVEWSKATAKVKLPLGEIGVEWVQNPVNLMQIVDILKHALAEILIENKHVVAIDGLDSFLFDADNQWSSATGLVEATYSLNQYFRENRLNLLVVVALRSDIYNVLPSAETNKYKQYSVQLDWTDKPFTALSPLWEMLHRKVHVDRPAVRLVEDYLSEQMPAGRYLQSAVKYVMEYTRLLPRDIVAMMNELQVSSTDETPLSVAEVEAGVKAYCNKYFEGEVFNNLAGVLPKSDSAPRKVIFFKDALRTVRRRLFTFDEVQADLEGMLTVEETTTLLRQMFEVGAVGVRNANGREEYTDFIYRRVGGAGFTKKYGFALHNALASGWNRPF